MKIIKKLIARIMDLVAPTEQPVRIDMHCEIYIHPQRPAICAKLTSGETFVWIWDVGREEELRKRITREASCGRLSWYHAAWLIRETREIEAMAKEARV